MPYKNKEDRIAYYHRHQKQYIYDWREKSDHWNKYQNEYAKRKRRENINLIKSEIRELNIGHGNSLCVKACVIFLYMIEFNRHQQRSIAYMLNYKIKHVDLIFSNWEKYGIYKDKLFNVDLSGNNLEIIIELTLMGLVGSGHLIRIYNNQ